MELNLTATTERAARLAKQFVSHWGRHADEVERDGDRAVMRFPAGDWPANTVLVEATPTVLGVTVRTDDASGLTAICDSVADHLHRFAGDREALAIEWTRTA